MDEATIIRATEGDVVYVAHHLRSVDLTELRQARGHEVDPVDRMVEAFRQSTLCWVAVDDEVPFAVFGVNPVFKTDECSAGDDELDARVGCPWLLATDRVYAFKGMLVRQLQPLIAKAHTIYPVLVNRVSMENKATIRWLEYLGFDIGPAQSHGPYGHPFRFFTKEI